MAKDLPFYQGGDWFTYRWSVAQAFDTLDQVELLCVSRPWGEDESSLVQVREVLTAIVQLARDLVGEIAIVEADTLSVPNRSFAQKWAAFEIRQHLDLLKKTAASGGEELSSLFEALGAIVASIKERLKIMDVDPRAGN